MTKVNSAVFFTYVAATNHRRPGSLGGKMIDFLMANPRSTSKTIVAAGHDGKHLRWDLEHNPNLFRQEIKVEEQNEVDVDGLKEMVLNTRWEVIFEPAATEPPAAVPSTDADLNPEGDPADGFPAAVETPMSFDDRFNALKDDAESIKSDLEAIRDEEQEYFDNMPEGLQNGDKGQAATEEVDAMEEGIDQLEQIAEMAC